jgi:hypothetical protein
MTYGSTLSTGPRGPMIVLVIVAASSFGLFGCQVTLRFDQPDARTDALGGDRRCATDQECSSALPRCDPTTGRCVRCLTSSDCSGDETCDPDSSSCRDPDGL